MLTAKDTGPAEAAGLGLGAEDCVAKPFSWRELLTRIRAALSRYRRSRQLPRRCVRHRRIRHA
jgi:DNA-binding response OmpR family regulator